MQPTGGRAQLERALAYQALLDAGEVESRAALARREGLTRARITQVMTLLRLAPGILAEVLAAEPRAYSERQLRTIAMVATEDEQRDRFVGLLAAGGLGQNRISAT